MYDQQMTQHQNGESIVPGVRKMAILRANALGDFIFSLPALRALRATYPDAEITWLGQRWHADFLKDRPDLVDRAIAIPRMKGFPPGNEEVPDPAEVERFFAAMQAERFDLAFQLHGGGRESNPFVLRLGARLTVGMCTPDAPPLDRWIAYIYYHPEVLRYLEVVSLVGARTPYITPQLRPMERDIAESCDVLPDADRPLVLLHPGATDSRRRWPAVNFAAAADALAARGARIAITGTEPERPLLEEVMNLMAADAVNLCGRLSLDGLVGMLSRADLVIANDTGPRHLAEAVNTPTIGIYWCGNMINGGPITRRYHRPLISWQLDCPVCGLDCTRHDCEHRDSFVSQVPVEDVLAAAGELL